MTELEKAFFCQPWLFGDTDLAEKAALLGVTKLRNSKCDKTQKLKILQNPKTQNVTKLKNSKCDKIQKHKMWQKTKTQNGTKFKNSKCE